jgi:hypothetical protein
MSFSCNFLKTAQTKQSPIGRKYGQSGTDVMIFKIFLHSAKKLAFLTQNKVKL